MVVVNVGVNVLRVMKSLGLATCLEEGEVNPNWKGPVYIMVKSFHGLIKVPIFTEHVYILLMMVVMVMVMVMVMTLMLVLVLVIRFIITMVSGSVSSCGLLLMRSREYKGWRAFGKREHTFPMEPWLISSSLEMGMAKHPTKDF